MAAELCEDNGEHDGPSSADIEVIAQYCVDLTIATDIRDSQWGDLFALAEAGGFQQRTWDDVYQILEQEHPYVQAVIEQRMLEDEARKRLERDEAIAFKQLAYQVEAEQQAQARANKVATLAKYIERHYRAA